MKGCEVAAYPFATLEKAVEIFLTGPPDAATWRKKLGTFVYALADAGYDLAPDSLRSAPAYSTRKSDSLPVVSCRGDCNARHSGLSDAALLVDPRCCEPSSDWRARCRHAFGLGPREITGWHAAYLLDDAARGEEAADSLEAACRLLPGGRST